jgi:CDP-diacylglycerol---serine O-phosphatidyltransferase
MKQIPNLFTLLNLVFGCLAIVCILQNGVVIQYNGEGSQYIDIPEKIWLASLFIAIAAIVDFLDGFVARLFKATSEMGKQLDSLADVVSFGVAPSMIIYQFLRMSFAKEQDGIEVSFLWLVPAFLIAVAGAYRLARFNLDSSQQHGFKGVPIPAVGLLVASLPMIYWHTSSTAVVDLPLMALKFTDASLKNNLPKIILLVFSLIAVVLFQWLSVPVIFIGYIILSLLFKNK